MKNLIKTILPQPVIHAARDIRDSISLHRSFALSFPIENLRSSNDVNLSILDDSEAAASWDKDYNDIQTLFGHDDRWGGINPGDRRALYTLIHRLKPSNVLEIGTHIGASTLYIARALKSSEQGRINTVDILDVNAPNGPWKSIGMGYSPRENAARLQCANIIDFIAQPSLNYMKATTEKFDLVFLDGDHTAATVYKEIAAALPLLNKDGLILLHDYYPEAKPLFPDANVIYGPFRALQRIKKEQPNVSILPLGTLPWETKQGSHNTSLALITRT